MLADQLIENEAPTINEIAKRVSGKRILLVTEQIRSPQCTYSVIGHYLFHILQAAGAKIIHHEVHVDARTTKTFDIGIFAYYETIERMRSRRIRMTLKLMRKICGQLTFYANLVPVTDVECDHYCLSRKCFLNSNDKWYRWWQFAPPPSKRFKNAVFVGRGVDPYLLKPAQEEFVVCLDSRFRGPIKQARLIKSHLESNDIKVRTIGFTDKTWQVPKMRFDKVAQIYNSTSVFISTIPGIYEMPAIEAQCAGNAIISYNDCLPSELCCDKTSYVCRTPEEVLEIVKVIQKDHDPSIPRSFVSKWTWTKVVEKMSQCW